MPGASTIDWNSTEAWQRMVAAILASGVKLNLRSVALHYGTTYDTLENRLRKIKKDAEVMKQEIDNGERTEVKAPATPRKPKTPSKKEALGTVTNGRVTKTTPSKKVGGKAKTGGVKQENGDGIEGEFFDDLLAGNDGSFNGGHGHAMNFEDMDFNLQ